MHPMHACTRASTHAPGWVLSALPKIDGTLMAPLSDIAPYMVDVNNPSTADPFAKTNGHVVAVRITAENGADGWKPTVGAIRETDFQSLPGVWGYFSVRCPNAEVHAFADSQFGHIFAHAPTRKQACYLLSLALKRLRVVGEIHTNIPHVRELIMTPDFMGNRIDTAWLDKRIAAQLQLEPPHQRDVAVCGALLKVHLAVEAMEAKLLKDYISRNACPPPEALQTLVELKVDFIWANTHFQFEVFRFAGTAMAGTGDRADFNLVSGQAHMNLWRSADHSKIRVLQKEHVGGGVDRPQGAIEI